MSGPPGPAAAPPPWTPADADALQRALDAAGPSALPGPSFGEYLVDLGTWLRDRLFDVVGRALPAGDWSAVERIALYGVAGAAALAAVLVLVVALRRVRRRGAGRPAVLPLAPPPPEEDADADWWGRELARRLEAGALRDALAAAWWWVALRLAPPGLDRSWTTGDLLRATGAADLRAPLARLERLQWGGGEPGRAAVEAVVAELREGLR